MSLAVNIEHQENYLHCKITGENNLHNVIHYLSHIHDAMLKYNCTNILVEENLKGKSLSLPQMFSVIRFANKSVFTGPHKIAYIDINPEHNIPHLALAISSAAYFFISVRMFSTVKEGKMWIEKN